VFLALLEMHGQNFKISSFFTADGAYITNYGNKELTDMSSLFYK